MYTHREFFNVGRALFSVEKIGDKCIVYDCGGESQSVIKTAIDNKFKQEEEIEAVFISHFDFDHINGIHYLLKRCNVKFLILPMLTQQLLILSLFCEENWREDDIRFIINPQEYVDRYQKQTHVMQVRMIDEETGEQSTTTFDGLLNRFPQGVIPSGTSLRLFPSADLDWIFKIGTYIPDYTKLP